LSNHQDLTVGEMHALGWGEEGEAWGWRRRLLVWEEDLVGEVKLLLSNVSLQATNSDLWLWHPNSDDGYTKVSICAWWLFRNRWSTKDNLQRRGIISLDAQLCISGCGQHETTEHLIIHCLTFGSLWQLVKSWLGVYSVDHQHVMDHFHQFIYSSGGHSSRRSFLHMVWLCCIWVLWNERNHQLFSNNVKSIMQLMEKVKITTLSWLKAKNVFFPFGYHMWWQQPLVCLAIG